jgi:hypothetical protein
MRDRIATPVFCKKVKSVLRDSHSAHASYRTRGECSSYERHPLANRERAGMHIAREPRVRETPYARAGVARRGVEHATDLDGRRDVQGLHRRDSHVRRGVVQCVEDYWKSTG